MKTKFVLLLFIFGSALSAFAEPNDSFFHFRDSLRPRDEYGPLHESKEIYPPDYESRYPTRWLYYLQGRNSLIKNPAYVGAMQRDLKRLGYYCGPIDGVYSDEVSFAIAQLQKNNSLRVTGTLTPSVRRALHLP